MVKNNIKN